MSLSDVSLQPPTLGSVSSKAHFAPEAASGQVRPAIATRPPQPLTSSQPEGHAINLDTTLRECIPTQSISRPSQALEGVLQIPNPEPNLSTTQEDKSQRPQTQRNVLDPRPSLTLPSRRPLPQDDDNSSSEASSSFETLTATVATGISPPAAELPQDHPYLKLKDRAYRVLFEGYRKLMRQHGYGSAAASESAGAPTNQRGAGHSKKRSRAQSSSAGNEAPHDSDSETPLQSPSVGAKRIRADGEIVPFACPYFKYNATAYTQCCTKKLSRIRDVKQHLRRHHGPVIYCARCGTTFADETRLHEHAQNVECLRRPNARPERMTVTQMQALSTRAPRGLSEEEQWNIVFNTLFPGHPLPRSPYLDSDLFIDMVGYVRYQQTMGPRILRNFLTARGTVDWGFPAGDFDALSFSIFQEALQQIFNNWADGDRTEPQQPQDPAPVDGSSSMNDSESIPVASSSAASVPTAETVFTDNGSSSYSFVPSQNNAPSSAFSWDSNEESMWNNFNLSSDSALESIITPADEAQVRSSYESYQW
jgi:hypothetical protein